MADVFDEVDEELRQERFKRRLKQYGPWVLAAVVVALLAAGGWTIWQNVRESRQMAQTDALVEAIDTARGEAAETKALEKFRQNHDGAVGAVATLHLAGILAQKGQSGRASSLYGELVAKGKPRLYSNLAALLKGLQAFDEASAKALQVDLAPLLDADSPWRFTAQWLVAHKLLSEGQTAAAGKRFKKLAEAADAPASLKRRVQPFAERYGG